MERSKIEGQHLALWEGWVLIRLRMEGWEESCTWWALFSLWNRKQGDPGILLDSSPSFILHSQSVPTSSYFHVSFLLSEFSIIRIFCQDYRKQTPNWCPPLVLPPFSHLSTCSQDISRTKSFLVSLNLKLIIALRIEYKPCSRVYKVLYSLSSTYFPILILCSSHSEQSQQWEWELSFIVGLLYVR